MWDYDSGGSGLIFKRGNGSRTGVKLFDEENVHNKDMEEQTPRGPPEENIAAPPANQSTLACRNLNYNVRHEGAEKQLLREVCGFAKPGQLFALMGTSGAGKTTLMDVLARRKYEGRIEEFIHVDGVSQDINFQRTTGYCEQNDVHESTATIREALFVSARLR